MSDHKRISPEETQALLGQGHLYVDVRTEQEFEAGHVPGAYNVPFQLRGAAGLVPNERFLAVMEAAFPKDTALVIGCQSGARSLKASRELLTAGFANLVELSTGFGGSRDAFGRPDPGWSKKGLPVSREPEPGRTYAELETKA